MPKWKRVPINQDRTLKHSMDYHDVEGFYGDQKAKTPFKDKYLAKIARSSKKMWPNVPARKKMIEVMGKAATEYHKKLKTKKFPPGEYVEARSALIGDTLKREHYSDLARSFVKKVLKKTK